MPQVHATRRAPRKSIARRTAYLVVGLASLAILTVPLLGENGLAAWFKLHSRQKKLAAEVADLEETHQELQAQLDALRNDPATLEKVAREEHNMRNKDEEVILVLPEADRP